MEQALLEAWENKQLTLPVITVDFNDCDLPKPLRITSLEAPHRIADALLRDSMLDGRSFRKTNIGKKLDQVNNRNATALFELCPTALIYGMWDSTGPTGGLGAKFARAVVSEIVGIGFELGVKTSSRIDPAQILKSAGPLYRAKEGDITWTLEEGEAAKDKKGPLKMGKDGKPSEANHSNVPPSITEGGVTIKRAVHTIVLSLPALRRLRFPLSDGKGARSEAEVAARITLAALGLCAAALYQRQGCDLRSRCQLHPTQPFVWELLDKPGAATSHFTLSAEQAVSLFNQAVEEAKKVGLPWMEAELILKPSPQLAALVRRSQVLAAASAEGGEGEG
jgi:CRISPR-associated protein Csb1